MISVGSPSESRCSLGEPCLAQDYSREDVTFTDRLFEHFGHCRVVRVPPE